MNKLGTILVTGAAGRLGTQVVARLLRAGHRVRATDVKPAQSAEVGEWRTGNLTSRDFAIALMRDVTHVAHLGNHASNASLPGDPQTVFNDNVAANLNVFQAASDAGVRRVVFASSIQAMTSEGDDGQIAGVGPLWPAQLPLDGSETPQPGNTYGLSKQVGEFALAYFARNHGLSGCALRLPHLFATAPEMHEWCDVVRPIHEAHAFAWLTNLDAARLVEMALLAELPGYRAYLPASLTPSSGADVAEMIARYYPRVPWRESAARSSLIDITALQRDFGWTPADWVPEQ